MIEDLLIANRGEIAIRIARSASDLGLKTTAIFAQDDVASLHTRRADRALALEGSGPAAYLDIAQVVRLAAEAGCDAIHPGYGFLSENAAFAQACEAAGLVFVGPRSETLSLFGDKAQARAMAERLEIPVMRGISEAVSATDARGFLQSLGPGGAVMLKAIGGGGGRGMRPVTRVEDIEAAFATCSREAEHAFGSGALYVEEFFPFARHIEVQVIGDGTGAVSHLWDRECSLQRQRQKVIEIAPAFGLPPNIRDEMLAAATRLAQAAAYRGLGTIEFLVDASADGTPRWVFIEANARLQVEHTVTEAVTGHDLVAAQLRIADGATLRELGLDRAPPEPRGVAIQARVNLETMAYDGSPRPQGGVLSAYEPPDGPGVRVDGFGYPGYATSVRYDPLLAKVIVHADDLPSAVARTRRALSEFKIAGPRTNIPFLQAILKSPALGEGRLHTRYVEEHIADLLADEPDPPRYFEPAANKPRTAGRRVDTLDPLAVLDLKQAAAPQEAEPAAEPEIAEGPPGAVAVKAPLQGIINAIQVKAGDTVRQGQPVALLEALKMEHVVPAPEAGVVREIVLEVGDVIYEGTPILFVEPAEVEGGVYREDTQIDLDALRRDVAEVLHYHQLTRDEARKAATEKRHAAGKRTARENIADLCDPGSFVEFGPIVTPVRYRDETPEELEARLLKTPADGMVMGIGRVNGELFGPERARCAVLSYDYSVLAGTQGSRNHDKTDRMLRLAYKSQLPVVLYSEGGGGRTGGVPGPGGRPVGTGGLHVPTWRELGKLSGLVPLVGVNSGYCFAGNVVLLGACDVIIATKDSSLGVGGPAVIEGGGLGAYAPAEVGPVSVQEPNGVIDIVVEDEAEATSVAKTYLSYFQGRTTGWRAHDQRILRHAVPENRRAVYDIRKVIETLADAGSVLELRRRFGLSMVTALVRIEGRPVGVVANNSNSPTGGAIDADGSDKAARFMQLCDAFDIPILSLIDTPGNMVGPDAEKTALIRHNARLYVAGANLTVPLFAVVLRKAYGLGALAMSTGAFNETFFTISWPTGEFAGMGLEGSIKLGRRAELLAITDLAERRARYEQLVAEAYSWAKALNHATINQVDDVIDPADTRAWLAMGLESVPPPPPRAGKKHAWVDTW
ncbi:acetyl-CoA carboxylase family protein [Phenylobacterium sp.]|jgi:acetyl/propionyl-CoA carboxylase alpha subunit/acetyl-CoA carboxylase carboxyltransferase component|uniref:acetyl-CoA carboxylase family protein n=1 Tax=Phenylobacterium sp. TaxID=1871053 RepID=UPI002F92BA4C